MLQSYRLRCHRGDQALRAPLHVWTTSSPEFIRQTGQIFGDFNDLLPSTSSNKINKLRGRRDSISKRNNFRHGAKKEAVFQCLDVFFDPLSVNVEILFSRVLLPGVFPVCELDLMR